MFDSSKITIYVMFLGYPRSGHSLIGSIIDAHENAAISHEYDVLAKIKNESFLLNTREILFANIADNTAKFNETNRTWNGYSYLVPGMFNGNVDNITIIGDKKGARSAGLMRRHSELFTKLQEVMSGLSIKYIHAIRNPYDNIASIAKRDAGKQSLDSVIKVYKNKALFMKQFRIDHLGEFIDVKNDELIADPETVIAGIMTFLGLPTTPEYLSACASIVLNEPRVVRTDITWTQAQKDIVANEIIAQCDFLTGYTF